MPGGSSAFALDAKERPRLVHSIVHGFGVGGKSAKRNQQGVGIVLVEARLDRESRSTCRRGVVEPGGRP